MSPIKAALHPQGSRVRIRRGRFPIDADLVGRAGTVVQVSGHRPDSYGVVLDGESRLRDFDETELGALLPEGETRERGDRGPGRDPGRTRSR